MTSRTSAPHGVPCWADLWTSDVEGSRAFYREVFGWESQDPDPDFGGYFMFTRQGVPVAGAMGDMGDMKATDTWKMYLGADDFRYSVLRHPSGHSAEPLDTPYGRLAGVTDPKGAQFKLRKAPSGSSAEGGAGG
jgi:predicted enzyme related to lactoylglutathione lyase